MAAEGCGWLGTAKNCSTAYDTAWNEAEKAFGDPTLYLEKFVQNPRHIEFQILADTRGRVVHLGERECSIQRRHQKIIEEAPSAAIDCRTPRRDGSSGGGRGSRRPSMSMPERSSSSSPMTAVSTFMEMNTRIQVEHPVTEMVTGVDLVREQLLIAGGEPMSIPKRRQVRLGAMPSSFGSTPRTRRPCRHRPGRITHLALPGGPGVRVDTHLYSGYIVPPYYDSLIAKLVVYGRDRREAIVRGRRALEMFRIEGIKTSIPLQLEDPQ